MHRRFPRRGEACLALLAQGIKEGATSVAPTGRAFVGATPASPAFVMPADGDAGVAPQETLRLPLEQRRRMRDRLGVDRPHDLPAAGLAAQQRLGGRCAVPVEPAEIL